jgi:membrane-bound lytic murein transglycosylase B
MQFSALLGPYISSWCFFVTNSYGAYTGKWDVIQALVTLGFTSEQATRREYFREQLIEAMLMLEAGHGPSGNRQLLGSWAGAMGQCQFMPSSFRQYAVDYDGDGHTGQIF